MIGAMAVQHQSLRNAVAPNPQYTPILDWLRLYSWLFVLFAWQKCRFMLADHAAALCGVMAREDRPYHGHSLKS
jgi:hypothetical protein